MSEQPRFVVPPELTRFAPLPRLARALASQRKVRIVAIGSSSTAGEGAVVPYPHRLELGLRWTFGDHMIDVLNRGIGGQEAPSELTRFENDVFAEMPALAIWQVGTNAIFHQADYNPDAVADSIATGLNWLRGHDIDAVLMDLQYAGALVKPEKRAATDRMVSRIAGIAKGAGVNVFRRFELMRRWCEADGIPLERMIDNSDGLDLHQNELSTVPVAQALVDAVINGVRTASAESRS